MFDREPGVPLRDVMAELNVALRECREHMRERGNDEEALDKLRQAVGKIELALHLLRSVRGHSCKAARLILPTC